MAKAHTLFGEENIPAKLNKKEKSPLPLIPLAKKKASKDDTPLEKEIRKFNKLIKDLHEMEADNAKQKEYDEQYEQLYQQKLLPEVMKLAKLKFEFAQHTHNLFEQGKFTKSQQRYFVEMINGILNDIAQFVPESRELTILYTNKHVQLLTKKDKQQLSSMMKNEGFKADIDNFDVTDMWKQNKERFEKDFLQNHTAHEKAQKAAQQQNKKAATQHQDINSLYRELARLLHPDLEQDENIRNEKEQLMKELSRARQHHDLHAMLVIKAKAQRFTPKNKNDKGENAFSLEQLKRYNQELRQKLNEYRNSFFFNVINNLSFNGKGKIGGLGTHRNPEKEIEMEMEEIKEAIKDFKADIKRLKTLEDLKEMIDTEREMEKQGWDPFGW